MGTSETTSEDEPQAGRRAARPSLLGDIGALVVYVLVALLIVSVVQSSGVLRIHNVASGSMRETLGVNDRILVSHLPYLGSGPARGDIVVFGHGDTWAAETRTPASNPVTAAARVFGDLTGIGTSNRIFTVKRVVGVAGDRVACCDADGRVTVNGEPLAEPYLFEDFPFEPGHLDCTTMPRSSRCFVAEPVPDASLLVMGDHRANSDDSVMACRFPNATGECALYVPVGRVVGAVIGKAWPPGPVG